MKSRIPACALVALVLLVSACSGSSSSSHGTSDAREPSYASPPPPAARPTARATASAVPSTRTTSEAAPADQISTFALDVDTASYGYARGTLKEGRLPDPAQVRPEEFVNAFRQGYAEPPGDGFAIQVDGARGAPEGT